MSKRHRYEYAVDLKTDTSASKVTRMVGSHKRVLEVGAGPGSITRMLKEHGQCDVTGIEVDELAVEKLKDHCNEVLMVDLNNPAWVTTAKERGPYDVVVAADVLEHLYDPWRTLSEIRTLLGDGAYVVVSLPHVGHSGVISCLVESDFGYRDWGLLDKTHIRFFSIKNIQALFKQAGLKIVEAEFVVRSPPQTEFSGSWRRLSKSLKEALQENRFGMVYQVVIRAIPATVSGKEINLLSMGVPSVGRGALAAASWKTKPVILLKEIARRCLSMRTRTKIAGLLGKARIKF